MCQPDRTGGRIPNASGGLTVRLTPVLAVETMSTALTPHATEGTVAGVKHGGTDAPEAASAVDSRVGVVTWLSRRRC
jgi:hypothetical protein